MAEVLAVGAGVIAIIQITDRIIGLCKIYIETVRDIPSDLRSVLIEASMLKTIFENLKFLMTNSEASSAASTLFADDGPVEGCRRSITELEKLFPSDCIQSNGQNGSKKRRVKASLEALAWPLKANKARKLLEEIKGYKATIALALTTESMYVTRFPHYLIPLNSSIVTTAHFRRNLESMCCGSRRETRLLTYVAKISSTSKAKLQRCTIYLQVLPVSV